MTASYLLIGYKILHKISTGIILFKNDDQGAEQSLKIRILEKVQMDIVMEYNELKSKCFRGLIEAAFIIFLFYANLLMGDFTHSGKAHGKSLIWAIDDVVTITNFEIAIVAAIVGNIFFEYLRKTVTRNHW